MTEDSDGRDDRDDSDDRGDLTDPPAGTGDSARTDDAGDTGSRGSTRGEPSGWPPDAPEGAEDWPVALTGVTESLVATRGPEGAWNLAALGLRVGSRAADEGVTARTWGRTRTRLNFRREGGGVVQFVADPVTFVDAALGIVEREDPVHPAADASVRVTVAELASGESGGTEWVDWALEPVESSVRRRRVPTVRRGRNAAIEATVWASRLGVGGYDDDTLRERLDFLESVVDAAGGPRARTAFDRIGDHVDWRSEDSQ